MLYEGCHISLNCRHQGPSRLKIWRSAPRSKLEVAGVTRFGKSTLHGNILPSDGSVDSELAPFVALSFPRKAPLSKTSNILV